MSDAALLDAVVTQYDQRAKQLRRSKHPNEARMVTRAALSEIMDKPVDVLRPKGWGLK